MIFCTDHHDSIATWWTSVIDVAAHWFLGEEKLDDVYKRVEDIPEDLLCLEDPLPKAILAAFIARKNYMTSGLNIQTKKVLKQCDTASQLFSDSLTYSSCKVQDNMVLVRIKFYYCFFFLSD